MRNPKPLNQMRSIGLAVFVLTCLSGFWMRRKAAFTFT